MFDRIDPRSPTPIYAQIAARVRVAVGAGELKAGDGLPSVRALASRLRVNPATVVQAYRELEAEGLVLMRQGAGTYVTDVTPERRERERAADARRLVRDLLAESARRGITAADLTRAFTDELKETTR
ncbi:MAG: GntR family transcriptional regulator [Gemmatimonadaceae bacterium]